MVGPLTTVAGESLDDLVAVMSSLELGEQQTASRTSTSG